MKKINTNVYINKIPKEGYQFICLSILFLKEVKIIIFKCFEKNVNMLLKKKRFLSILLVT